MQANGKEITMEEMQDYSGPLRRDLQSRVSLDMFSRDAIVRMIAEASKLYLGSEGGWHTVIRKRFGEQLANEMDREVWLDRAEPQVVSRLRKAFNIQGNDLASFLKFLQIEPLFVMPWSTGRDTGRTVCRRTPAEYTLVDCRRRPGISTPT
jgi:hypothetical protein